MAKQTLPQPEVLVELECSLHGFQARLGTISWWRCNLRRLVIHSRLTVIGLMLRPPLGNSDALLTDPQVAFTTVMTIALTTDLPERGNVSLTLPRMKCF